MKNRAAINVMLVVIIGILVAGVTRVFLPIARAEEQKADIVIIGNKNLPDNPLSKTDIQNIFLGKKKSLGGATVTCVILKSGDVHTQFLQNYLSRTPSQYEQYWKKIVFSGQGKSPKMFETETALLEYVKNTEGTIGYIGAATAQTFENGSLRQFTVQ